VITEASVDLEYAAGVTRGKELTGDAIERHPVIRLPFQLVAATYCECLIDLANHGGARQPVTGPTVVIDPEGESQTTTLTAQ
jgi:hypothetical protein